MKTFPHDPAAILRRGSAALALLACLLPRPLPAQETVTLTRIAGEEFRLPLDAIRDGSLSGGDQQVRLDDLRTIRTDRTVQATSSPVAVRLAGGGELGATEVRFTGERFEIDCRYGQFAVSPDCVQGVIYKPGADLSRFHRALQNRSVEQDVVIAKTSNGQAVVWGLIESISDGRVVMNYNGRSRPVSLSKVVAIVTADLKPREPAGPRGTVQLVDGSTIPGGIGDLTAAGLEIRLAGGSTVHVEMSQVVSISLKSNRVIYLSDLEPLDAEQHSLATIDFGWKRDLSVDGNPLRLHSPDRGKTLRFAKGIGTHAASRLEFAVPDQVDRLVATVGIDAETGGKGDCVVSIWADGIRLWESQISGNSEPLAVDVPVGGMKSVSLVVRNGKHLDLGDHVNWADIRFLKTAR